MEEEFNWPWFINNIWKRENAAGLAKTEGKGGYYNGRYHPYKATNGIDVGPGFDLAHQSEAFKRKAYSTGFTKEELDDSLRVKLEPELGTIDTKITKLGGRPSKVTNDVKAGLLDIYHQRNNGLYSEFPKLWNAVVQDDYKGMQNESRTTYTGNDGKTHPDNGRWEYRKKTYFHTPIPASIKRPQETKVPKFNFKAPETFTPKKKLFSDGGTLDNSWNNLSQKEKSEMMKVAVHNGITTLPEIKEAYNKFVNPTVDENGNTYTSTWKANEYGDGGYKPSESIKKRISTWEGSSMKTNRSFAAEASDFNRVVPASVRAKLSSNQLDALYSYGYNVGMGNLKQRVVPVLTAYTQGKASKEDVQRAMWASRDNELRGLTTRRNAEREMFGGNYRTAFTGTGKLGVHINPSEYTAYEDLSPMIDNINIPQLELPDAMKTDPTKAFTPPVIDTTLFANPKVQEESEAVYNPMQERKDNIQTFNTVMGLLGGSSPLTGLPTDSSGLLSYIGQIYS